MLLNILQWHYFNLYIEREYEYWPICLHYGELVNKKGFMFLLEVARIDQFVNKKRLFETRNRNKTRNGIEIELRYLKELNISIDISYLQYSVSLMNVFHQFLYLLIF